MKTEKQLLKLLERTLDMLIELDESAFNTPALEDSEEWRQLLRKSCKVIAKTKKELGK